MSGKPNLWCPMIFSRRSILLGLAGTGAGICVLPRRAVAADFSAAEQIPVELFQDAQELEGAVQLGHPHGDVVMIEFFDYNCPWCRRSAVDLPQLLKSEPNLSYILVNFAILGQASAEATRVALGYRHIAGSKKYLPLHQAIFDLRGRINGERALGEAVKLGIPQDKLIATAESDRISLQMKEALKVGNSLGFSITPSFAFGNEAYPGSITYAEKRAIIARQRQG